MMLISVYMMSAQQVEAGLLPRLGRLNGRDDSCSVTEYRKLAKNVLRRGEFRAALQRSRALADERRLTAVALLRRRDLLCACELQAALGVSHATVSHHMGILVSAGIVSSERRGKWLYYRLNPKGGVAVP